MTRPIDLGHGLFQATESPLQLHFSATANFSQVGSGQNPSSTIKLGHWKDLQLLWITGAPELELRVIVTVDPVIETIGPTFAASLEEELCNSKAWTDLGFDIIFKSRLKFWDSIASGTHCLAFGLCRRNTLPASVNSRSIPPILRNPPEAHIPSDVPTACLVSIDLHLEYAICDTVLQLEAQILETLKHKFGDEAELQQGSCSTHHTDLNGNIAVATFALSTKEDLLLPFDQPFDANGNMDVDHQRQTTQMMKYPQQISIQLLNLFEFGLQKLILPGVARNSSIKTVGKNMLQNLSLLVPSLFNPECREAMKQRAASLSTISKSLISMLENSNNPVLQNKLSAILRESTNSEQSLTSETPPERTHENLLTNNLKSAMELSLWSISQHRLSKTKALQKPASFFALNNNPKKPPAETDDDIILPVFSDREFACDSEILGLEGDTNLPPSLNYSPALDELLSDGSSMLTFQDPFESTQSTEITQTTQKSIENFSQVSECLPDTWDDIEILLSDEILMDESLDGYETFEDIDLF